MEKDFTLNVLVADDDPTDHQQFCQALSSSEVPVKILSVYNGMKLIDYLEINGGKSNASVTMPQLIITDLYMPFAGGIQVLKQIRRNLSFSGIPIYVFSRNDDQVVRAAVLKNGATAFHRKPERYDELQVIIHGLIGQAATVNQSR